MNEQPNLCLFLSFVPCLGGGLVICVFGVQVRKKGGCSSQDFVYSNEKCGCFSGINRIGWGLIDGWVELGVLCCGFGRRGEKLDGLDFFSYFFCVFLWLGEPHPVPRLAFSLTHV